jgi:hypothetical protein
MVKFLLERKWSKRIRDILVEDCPEYREEIREIAGRENKTNTTL